MVRSDLEKAAGNSPSVEGGSAGWKGHFSG